MNFGLFVLICVTPLALLMWLVSRRKAAGYYVQPHEADKPGSVKLEDEVHSGIFSDIHSSGGPVG